MATRLIVQNLVLHETDCTRESSKLFASQNIHAPSHAMRQTLARDLESFMIFIYAPYAMRQTLARDLESFILIFIYALAICYAENTGTREKYRYPGLPS